MGLVFFALVGLFALTPLTALAQPAPPQRILILSDAMAAKAVRSGPAFKVIKTYDRYVLVEIRGPQKLETLKKLVPSLESVEKNEFYTLQADASPCLIFATDTENTDKQISNTDLMNEYMEKLGLNLKSIPVAVIDSGVDPENVGKRKGEIVEAMGEMEDPSHNGHGSSVVDRVLQASPGSKVVSYGIFKTNRADSLAVLGAIEQACNAGHKIINLSASNAGMPAHKDPAMSNLRAALKKKGCWLIEAAGNDHRKTKYKVDPDIPTIGSLRPSGELGKESNHGVLYAPGSGILTRANNGGYGLFNGTSQATPVVSAIAKDVYVALNSSKKFAAMDESKKVETLFNVLKASAVNDAVDGLRAVVLAASLAKDDFKFFPHEKEPNDLLRYRDQQLMLMKNFAPFAFYAERGKVKPVCKEMLTCDEKQIKCFKDKRRYVALTPNAAKPDLDDIEDLKITAEKSGQSGIVDYWKHRIDSHTAPAGLTTLQGSVRERAKQ